MEAAGAVAVNKAGNTSATALASPALDFWMLGGGSLLLIPLIGLTLHMWDKTLGAFTFLAVICGQTLVTMPHFAFSYLLFYSSFITQLRNPALEKMARLRLLIAGIVAPAALAALIALAYKARSEHMLIALVMATSILTGWHYAKQGYGALITLSVYKKFFYSAREKTIILANTYSVWLFTAALYFSVDDHAIRLFGLDYRSSFVPTIALFPLGLVSAVTTIATIAVFIKHWRAGGGDFPVNGMLAYFASVYIWAAFFRDTWTIWTIVPLFHSLQYLFFVWRFKSGEFAAEMQEPDTSRKYRSLVALVFFLVGGFLLGNFFMNSLPIRIDNMHVSDMRSSLSFFYLASYIFFNTHHYFIDAAFWRRDNTRVQQYLFKARA